MTQERLNQLMPKLKETHESMWWRLIGERFITLDEWMWLCRNRATVFAPKTEHQMSLDPGEQRFIEAMT